MKFKKVRLLLLGVICFITFNQIVNANSVNVKGSSSTITKGTTITITATVYSDAPWASIEGTLTCTGSGVSESMNLGKDDSSNSLYSQSYSLKIKPTVSGTVACTTSGVRLTNMNSGDWQNVGNDSTSITVKEPVYVAPKQYSSNNYLKELSIDEYQIDFKKDTLEYSVEVESTVDKVKINAVVEDSKANVSGTGEIPVVEGANKLEIKVTAENGNEKVYIINVNVKELDPIIVKISKKEYTVIRKEGIIVAPESYEKTTTKINNEEVLAYYNEKTKYTLVGLKDSEGNSFWYIYDSKKNTYTSYNSLTMGGMSLAILEMPNDKLPSGYSKVTFNYNDIKLEGYQYQKKNVTYAADEKVKAGDFYLFYAVNVLTGEKALYSYDKIENTVQRFNNSLVLTYQNKADNYLLYFLITISVFAISIIALTIVLIKKGKHKSKFA